MAIRVRAQFSFEANIPGRVLAIADRDAGAMSITNDAEAVVSWLTARKFITPGKRLIYRDTDGRWDELQHDGQGKFMGFKSIGLPDLDAAIVAVTERVPA